ncbi:hypothetical protein AZE42_13729 [Rhizopogon vesiculosus]|uniref:Uncharacterized protein n=1 Tax=Rhizopogon vesiculosus TaxID=180088 RepID=A0A1J8QJP1_9AGAM|nr:hypothetical protein AZE42_13729 [Rhizopogon vesiculosus]
MGYVYIHNNTSSAIHVRITADGESGSSEFFGLSSGRNDKWSRSKLQPDMTYAIG